MTDHMGTLVTVDGRPALRFERRYDHPAERVFRAISDPDEMRAWFPANVEGERAAGAPLRFADDEQLAAGHEAGEPVRAEGPMFTGRVVVHDPPNVFAFTWGGELLRFELHPDGAATVLVFTHVLAHQSTAARNGAGWHACLDALDAVLGAAAGRERGGWAAVYDAYIDRAGPLLATGAPDGRLVWERGTHVAPERVRAATSDLDRWGAAAHAGEPLQWEVEPHGDGSLYRLVHSGIGGDAKLAAAWHALLLQLDMWLASGQLVPVDSERWIDAYSAIVTRTG